MALVIAVFLLPVSALLSVAVALAIAWPRRRLELRARRALAIAAAFGLAHLAPWALALSLDVRRGTREDIVCAGGVALALLGLAAVALVVARAWRAPGARRALAWLLPHSLFLCAYLSDFGRFGVREML